MKVCILGRYNPEETLTGPEKVAKRLFETVAARDNETVFLEYFFDGKQYGLLKKLFGFEIVSRTGNGTVLRCGILRLNRVLWKLKPRILHVASFERFAVVSLVYRSLTGARFVYTVNGVVRHEERRFHANFPRFLRLKDGICERLLMTRADKLIFLSKELQAIASSYYRFDPARSAILPNGIDKAFHTVRRNPRAKPRKRRRIVFIADVTRPEKGFGFLHDALARIREDVDLYIVGSKEPPAHEPLKRVTIHHLGMKTTEALAHVLSEMDIYVSSSSYEPFSLAAVEAMAAGVVPVVTAETGMARYINEGKNGFVVPYGDTMRLAGVLRRLVRGGGLVRRVGGNARKIYSVLS